MSSVRFLVVKWGFKARHRGDDHAYCVISSMANRVLNRVSITIPEDINDELTTPRNVTGIGKPTSVRAVHTFFRRAN